MADSRTLRNLLVMYLLDEDDEDEALVIARHCLTQVQLLTAYTMRVHGRHDSFFSSSLDEMNELTFFQHLRLSKAAFAYLHELLQNEDDAAAHPRGKEKLTLRECLYITLWYLANKTTFRAVSLQFNISMSTASRIFYSTLSKIGNITKNIIKWPSDLDETEANFREIAGFPGIIGAIDGTHITISPPGESNDFLDRTMKHSMVLLAVCDASKKFTYISAGFAGSIHDQRCLSLSVLGEAVKSYPNTYFPRQDVHIIGDSAFTLQTGLLVPFKDNGRLSAAQRNYNFLLSKTRVLIENAFGLLKSRFRCLMKLEVDLEHMPKIIAACCTLHNVALMFPDGIIDPLQDSTPIVDVGTVQETVHDNPNAVGKRQAICNMLSGNM